MRILTLAILTIAVTALCPILPVGYSTELQLKSDKASGSSKLNSNLKRIMNKISVMSETRSIDHDMSLSSLSNQVIKIDDVGNVQVYLHCSEVSDENLKNLLDLGLIVEIINEDLKIIQGWLPYESLEAAADMGFVVNVTPPDYAHRRAGSVQTEGDAVMNSDDVRNTLGFDGSGVLIGVISDGVDSIAASQATGDLPGSILIGDPGDGDEGTAMLDIVHDVAPGADLAFHTAFPTSLAFLDAITFFMNNGANIIVDDVGFLGEPYFQDGALAQAVQDAADSGIIYVSAAGNDAQEHYQAFYFDDGGLDPDNDLHDFGAAAGDGSELGMTLQIPPGGRSVVFLQWSDPFGSSSNDYDLFLVDSFSSAVLASSQSVQNGTQDPFEFVIFDNPSNNSSFFVDIIIEKFSGSAQTLEMHFNGNEIITEFNVPDDAIFGHPAALGAIATAAFDYLTPNTIEGFSSLGPASIISPANAVLSSITTNVAIAEERNKPDISGPDGVSTTAPGFATFFGTSAAAPHVAAVAALVYEALEDAQVSEASSDPTIATKNALTVRNALTSTAVDIGAPGFDFSSGAGRIDALAAVQAVAGGPTPPPTPTPAATPTPSPTGMPTPTPTGNPPTPTPTATSTPTDSPPATGTPTPVSGSSKSNKGCALASGPAELGTAAANLLIPLVPVAVAFGLRARRKRK